MATRSVIRLQCRLEIDQTDSANSDYSDDQLNDAIDQTIKYVSSLVSYPREFVEITPVAGTSEYDISATALTKDTLNIRLAYYGDKTIANDVYRMMVTTEEKLSSMFPSWLSTNSESFGRPIWLFMKTFTTIAIFPTPDTTNAASGKKIILNRTYSPAALTSDSDSPNLPVPYHDLIKFWVAFLCYSGKLKNQEMAASKYNAFIALLRDIKPTIDKDTIDGYEFGFVVDEGLNDEDNIFTIR